MSQTGAALIWLLVLVPTVSLATAARGIDLPLPGDGAATLRGYYKNFLLVLDSSEPQVGDGVEDLNRARLMFDGNWPEILDFSFHYEQFAVINPVEFGNLFLGPTATTRPGVWDLRWTIYSDDSFVWQQDIDRLFVHRRFGKTDVTLGRQAIGWGVGLIWSPHDLFAPFSPVEIDREYRLGIDAARALVSLGTFTEVEGVYALYDGGFEDHVIATRWRHTLAESDVDIGFIGGKFFEDAVVGFLAAGEIKGVGIHGECTYTHDFDEDDSAFGPEDFVRAVVGADYRFPGEVRALAEYYFNGYGASDPSDYLLRLLSPRFARGEIFNVGRHYLGFAVDWEAHPLVHLIAQGQWNLADPSAQVGPALTFSLTDEAQLDAGAYFGLGAGLAEDGVQSEFGSVPDTYYVAAKIYF